MLGSYPDTWDYRLQLVQPRQRPLLGFRNEEPEYKGTERKDFSEESETVRFDFIYNTLLPPKMVPIRRIFVYQKHMMPHSALSSSNSLGKSNKDFLAQKGHTVVLFSNITSRKNKRKKNPSARYSVPKDKAEWFHVSHFQSLQAWHLWYELRKVITSNFVISSVCNTWEISAFKMRSQILNTSGTLTDHLPITST